MLPSVYFSDESTSRLDAVKYWNIYFKSAEYGSDYTGNDEGAGKINESLLYRENYEYGSPMIKGEFKQGWITLSFQTGQVTYVFKPAGCTKVVLFGSVSVSQELTVKSYESFSAFPSTGNSDYAYYAVKERKLYIWDNEYKVQETDKVYVDGATYVYKFDKDANLTYDFMENERLQVPAQMVIAYAHKNLDQSPEISRHRVTDDKSYEGVLDMDSYIKSCGFSVHPHQLQINGSNYCMSRRDYLDCNKLYINKINYTSIPEFQSVSMTRSFQKFIIGAFKNS